MAKVSYDVDTSGGLMDQIQKLISPPEESRKKATDSTTRRGGRVVSKEACDSCGEGGDLLCCDKCFAAFHLLCHDPPLNEDDVPFGEWLCRQCRSAKGNYAAISVSPPDDAQSTTSSRSNRSNSLAGGNSKQRGQRKKTASTSVPVGRGTPEGSVIPRGPEMPSSEEPATSNGTGHPLSRLARDWRNLNPREFSLPIVLVPNDLEPTAPIGNSNGSSDGPIVNPPISNGNNKRQRISTYAATIAASSAAPSSLSHGMGPPFHGSGPSTPGQSNSRRRSALPIPAQTSGANYEHQLAVYHSSGPPPAKKPILVPDGNIVSLQPLILCYVCSRSCRSAPLLQCDYCPLAFHLDCLEMPLSTFPSSPWMCPNHPEHYLDVAFAPESRHSLSKRIQLWHHYSADNPIDFNAIKLRFLEKVHRPDPPHRSQVNVVPVGSATQLAHIPESVKAAYSSGVDPNSFTYRSSKPLHENEDIEPIASTSSLQLSLQAFSSKPMIHAVAENDRNTETKKEEIAVLPSVVEAIMNVVDGKALPFTIVSQLDSSTMVELARQRLEQLAPVPSSNEQSDATTLALKALLELSTGGKTAEDQVNEALTKTKQTSARALLVPLDRGLVSTHTSLPVVSKCASIGTSSKCAINLSRLVQASGCSRVSPLHGVVTFDELTDTYELLVYSEHGAIVDGVRYGVGLALGNHSNTSISQIEQNEQSRQVAVESCSPQRPVKRPQNCNCSCASDEVPGAYSFDGPAPLRHGSLIQIGCLRFVFARVLLADVKREVAGMSSSVTTTAVDNVAMEVS